MKSSKYVDVPAIVQVIGNIFINPSLLDVEDKYTFNEDDFPSEFHKIVFGSMYNIWHLGGKSLSLETIEDYLSQRPSKKAIYDQNKGGEYILSCKESAQTQTFDYYYQRLKKMSLLRGYESLGMDLNFIYNPDELDVKKQQQQEDWLDNSSLLDIVKKIDDKIDNVKLKYADLADEESAPMSDGIEELIEKFRESPEIGYPLFGPYINTITRGARLGKFYLRSAATGVGKSRSMVADACYIGCNQIWDLKEECWKSTGAAQPTLYIATEQDLSELQTMCLAFISGVDEEHILTGQYYVGEYERVKQAAQIIKAGSLYFESMPDFSLQDVENTVKKNIRDKGVIYIFLHYLHTSMKVLEDITRRSGGVRLREDNILFMMSIRLKDICVQYNVFIMSATQLNSDYQTSETPDQNLLRGAKSIADKIDTGMIMLEVTQADREKLAPIIQNRGLDEPIVKISIYKNRRGRWKGIYLWCKANRGICRIEPMFATKYNYEVIELEDLMITVA